MTPPESATRGNAGAAGGLWPRLDPAAQVPGGQGVAPARPACQDVPRGGDGVKQALVLQHMVGDHPGRFLDFFAEDGILPHVVRLWDGEAIPSLAPYDLMFVLGGTQDAWQEADHPWLVAEKQAIREWVQDRARPYIGVCLGHQLLCDALGGEVAPSGTPEVGVFDIALTDTGRHHPLLAGLAPRQPVMQFHLAEVKRAPPGAAVLAASERAAVQSVAIGAHAIGTQFHCECSPQTLAGWASAPAPIAFLERHLGPDAYRRLLATSYPLMPQMHAMARRIYDNLVVACGLRATAAWSRASGFPSQTEACAT
ncbi:type 1 glutamine amidotransferase [Vineibacter terrae]|uniref:Type 1 glutamine amidotransferase n=1 Tax=Vineibacter terrae TaxID=2586908 RepID=A0A5C8PUH4_9HYPH|nr:type 1 glutamine amidotransferase [Vineibacter terrae]